jgi:16S rRNA (guanine1207-N2)-methyltransferase
VFSWDRLDPGSALLLGHLPSLAGRGADLGCGVGVLARRILESQAVTALALVDIDRRAVDAARLNVADPRAAFAWDDVRRLGVVPEELDFVVTNPPFHDGGAEDRGLGLAFIAAAAAALRRGGTLWLVANRGLPYEAALEAAFARVQRHAEAGGYKVYEARR